MRKPQLLPNANPPDSKYPDGSYKASSTPEAKDGTPILADSHNDTVGFHSALLRAVGKVANGIGEGVGSSQLLEAIKVLIQRSSNSLNDAIQRTITDLRTDMKVRDNNVLNSATEHTDTSVQAQDSKSKQYANNARVSAINNTAETLKSYVTLKYLASTLLKYVTITALTKKLKSYVTNSALKTKLAGYSRLNTITDKDELDYPIGTMLCTDNGREGVTVRNAEVFVYLRKNDDHEWTIVPMYGDTTKKLKGTWRYRGGDDGMRALVQRVS